MKMLKKLVSVLVVCVMLVTSLAVGAVSASAASTPKTPYAIGKYTSSGMFHIDFKGSESDVGYSTGDLYSAVHDRSARKADALAYLFLFKNDDVCYGFLMYESTGVYTYPVMIDYDKIEDAIKINKFTYMGCKFGDLTSEMCVATQGTYGEYYFTIDPGTDTGAKMIKGLKGAEKGYFSVCKVVKDKFYGLDGDDVEFKKFTPSFSFSDTSSSSDNVDKNKIALSALKVEPMSNQVYTGKALKPDVKIRLGTNYYLTKDKDYTLKYSNNTKIGTATVQITMKGNYSGSTKTTFKIVPPTTTMKASKSSGKFNISWKKISGITKYEIYYSTDGGDSYKKAGTVSSSKTSCTLSLNTNKKHVFRMRAYKTVNGTKYYSAWSNVVTVKK